MEEPQTTEFDIRKVKEENGDNMSDTDFSDGNLLSRFNESKSGPSHNDAQEENLDYSFIEVKKEQVNDDMQIQVKTEVFDFNAEDPLTFDEDADSPKDCTEFLAETSMIVADSIMFVEEHNSLDPKFSPEESYTKDAKRLKCSECNYTTDTQRYLRRHINRHKNRKAVYKCSECDYCARNSYFFNKHMKCHEPKSVDCCKETSSTKINSLDTNFSLEKDYNDDAKRFKCSECNYATDTQRYFQRHIKRHENRRPLYKCSECDYYARNSYIFYKHMQCHEPNSIMDCLKEPCSTEGRSVHEEFHGAKSALTCGECSYTAMQATRLETHIEGHRSELLRCNECEFLTDEKSKLEDHIKLHTRKMFHCSECEFWTSGKQYLLAHMKKGHLGDRPYKCDRCGFRFAYKSKLKEHNLRHDAVKPFKCELCDYCSVKRHELVAHTRTHTGEKPYKCTICNYSSAHKKLLNIHLLNHKGEKPFRCPHCEYCSSQRAHLIVHLRSHTGEKPFSCDQCNFTSAVRSSLKRHMLTQHRD